jgi:predicted O-methyltransferase YrrM
MNLVRKLRSELSFRRHRVPHSRKIAISSDPYATHKPVLIAIANIFGCENILELGSGCNSTTIWDNRYCFPNIRSVTSLEDSQEWFDQVKFKIKSDSIVNLQLVDSVPESAGKINIDNFDMIFIDDSVNLKDRALSIKNIVNRCNREAIIVIHDFENKKYQGSIRAPWQFVEFSHTLPMTGVAFTGDNKMKLIERTADFIRENSDIAFSNIDNWRDILKNLEF